MRAYLKALAVPFNNAMLRLAAAVWAQTNGKA